MVIQGGLFTRDFLEEGIKEQPTWTQLAEATRDGAPAIDLIDGEALCGLLKDLKLGVKVKLVEQVEVDSAFFGNV